MAKKMPARSTRRSKAKVVDLPPGRKAKNVSGGGERIQPYFNFASKRLI